MIVAPAMPAEPPPLTVINATVNAPPESIVALMLYTIPFDCSGNPTLTLPMGTCTLP